MANTSTNTNTNTNTTTTLRQLALRQLALDLSLDLVRPVKTFGDFARCAEAVKVAGLANKARMSN